MSIRRIGGFPSELAAKPRSDFVIHGLPSSRCPSSLDPHVVPELAGHRRRGHDPPEEGGERSTGSALREADGRAGGRRRLMPDRRDGRPSRATARAKSTAPATAPGWPIDRRRRPPGGRSLASGSSRPCGWRVSGTRGEHPGPRGQCRPPCSRRITSPRWRRSAATFGPEPDGRLVLQNEEWRTARFRASLHSPETMSRWRRDTRRDSARSRTARPRREGPYTPRRGRPQIPPWRPAGTDRP
jgi:hypothetical protein